MNSIKNSKTERPRHFFFTSESANMKKLSKMGSFHSRGTLGSAAHKGILFNSFGLIKAKFS